MGFRHPAVWVALILLIVVLFGASKLPDITRNLGKSMKIFKEEVRDLRDDVDGRRLRVGDGDPGAPTLGRERAGLDGDVDGERTKGLALGGCDRVGELARLDRFVRAARVGCTHGHRAYPAPLLRFSVSFCVCLVLSVRAT